MNLAQFQAWTRARFGTRGSAEMRRAAALLAGSVDPRRTSYSAFEAAMKSSAPGVVKFAHLHLYPAEETALRRRKADGVRALVRALRLDRRGFDAASLLRALDALERLGMAGEGPLFGCEYEPARRRFAKATLYGLTRSPARLAALAGALGLPARRPPAWARRLDCLGVDFLPDGRFSLKAYERRPSRARAVRRVLVLRRFGPDGRPGPPGKVALQLHRGVDVGAGLRAYHVAVEPGSIELYVRRPPAPWER